MTKIKEIFTSIQGEGKYIGYKQLFIRFCTCNLHCKYCDTDFSTEKILGDFTPVELADYINENFDLGSVHSISLTGGEPLVSVKFLKDFLPLISDCKVYLETNATLVDELEDLIDYVDIIAADIKLESATGLNTMNLHNKFFEIAKNKDCFAKIVFDNSITQDEIIASCDLAKKYNIELILQPKMMSDKMAVSVDFAQSVLEKFLSNYKNVRLIPQVHKFINVR